MKKWIWLLSPVLFFSMAASAQQFEASSSETTKIIEDFVGRYGTAERIYITDAKNKTFEVPANEKFGVVFAYEVNDKVKRRMMMYQMGPKGEKVKIHYPGMDKGYRIGSLQLFGLRLTSPGDAGAAVKYKIDSNPSATVYIYKLIPGVK
jgi:hypothetical protein